MNNQDAITISLTILATEDGRYLCQMIKPDKRTFSGQTKEHAIAIALEHLAAEYRTIAEKSQEQGEDVESEDSQMKRYHVILHYERIAEEQSRFDAVLNTLLGNTVVENAITTVIEISPDADQQLLG